MRTFKEFTLICEALYDTDRPSDVQQKIGKVGADRKKTAPERRRMKAVGGGKMVPAKDYKDRKDIGKTRARSTREQQPTKERGSAALTPREQQAKARRERMAARGATKVKSKDLSKQADKLLATKKKKKADPNYKPQKASGMTRDERHRLRNAARRLMRDMRAGKDKPASAYDPNIKNFGKQTGTSYSNTGVVPKGRKKGS